MNAALNSTTGKLLNTAIRHIVGVAVFCLAFGVAVLAQSRVATAENEKIVFDNMPEQEAIVFSKDVIVRGHVKGVLVFGGDLVIEGDVSGDVAVIGGTVLQKSDASIGGDVIVIGGGYNHEARKPDRNSGTETLVYAGYEDELRSYAREPAKLLSPTISAGFVVQRFLSLVFWFVVGLLISLIAPGAVSRAVTKFRMSKLSVLGLGASAMLLATVLVVLSVSVFPGFGQRDYRSNDLRRTCFLICFRKSRASGESWEMDRQKGQS